MSHRLGYSRRNLVYLSYYLLFVLNRSSQTKLRRTFLTLVRVSRVFNTVWVKWRIKVVAYLFIFGCVMYYYITNSSKS